MGDLKYIAAYLIPLSAIHAITDPTHLGWATVVLGFVALPLIEQIVTKSTQNVSESEEPVREKMRFYDYLLYLNLPLVYGIAGGYLYLIATTSLPWITLMGVTLSTGIVLGTNGINVAHELGHRNSRLEQAFSKWLLLPCLYQHFFIEHNRGHHKHVATELDPATSRYGEWVYTFWFRSVSGGWVSAWKLEAERLQKAGLPLVSWHNEMIRFSTMQIVYLTCIATLGGGVALAGAIVIAMISWLLLESINYIEHYGLLRKKTDSGRYEPVLPAHSWNSNHEMGRIFLYELTRHSDHHYKANRKYQNLRHMAQSPQLPLGYPGSILLALVPPLWFAVMNPRVMAWRNAIG